MSKTLIQLVRELADRRSEHNTVVHTGGSGTTTLTSANMKNWLPQQLAQSNFWIRCPTASTDTLNRGVSRRTSGWNSTTTEFSFIQAWPTTPLAGGSPYDLFVMEFDRYVAALNEAIGYLELYWSRDIVDDSITTQEGVWKYTLNAAIPWFAINDIQLQINTDASYATYPYRQLREWNWRTYSEQDPTTGAETWYVQFATLPPPDRILRVFGTAYYDGLALDADVLAVGGRWEVPALAWVYQYANYVLDQQQSHARFSGEEEKYRQLAFDAITDAGNKLKQSMRTIRSGIINVPGKGDGTFQGSPSDWRYFGAFSNTH